MTQTDVKENKEVRTGIYRHYSGRNYRVHYVVKHSESLEEMVVYEALYDNHESKFWVRPKSMFLDTVEIEGVRMPRFEYLGDNTQRPKQNNTEDLKLNDLVKLFSILQLTKDQPLTGYLVAGIKLSETSTLAEHHYTTTLSGYLIAKKIKQAGGKIDEYKLVRMLLVHDLSELFGGDIASPLNRKYPDLREHKDAIGERAMQLLGEFTGEEGDETLKNLYEEFEQGKSDEAVVGKIMDQMDHQFYLEHNNYHSRYYNENFDYRVDFTNDHIYKLTGRIKDPVAMKVMDDFLAEFKENFFNKGYNAINFLMRKKD